MTHLTETTTRDKPDLINPELESADYFGLPGEKRAPPGSWLGWVIIGSALFWIFVALWGAGVV
ncbi:hypothetical protein [Roseovarius sp. MMSF_3350]|uniref:hypothetical protein n=1 Tax=Roseovarius sp. MMSF_3350 TaxID=3046706 RepID=UPI00273D3C67|nr:hypothetical protein [Roseovarius sp. MMSF_3350]